jgi:hypothetical protein
LPYTIVRFLEIKVQTGNCIVSYSNLRLNIQYCYFLGNSTSNSNACLNYYCSTVMLLSNYFSNVNNCIYGAFTALIQSQDNSVTGTTPATGLSASNGTTIAEYDATQPAATVPTWHDTGGQIRTP